MPLIFQRLPKRCKILIVALLISTGLQACTPTTILLGTASVATVMAVVDRRPVSVVVEDQAIEMKLTDSIYADKDIGKKVHVSVVSVNGVVLLTGEVPNQEIRLRIQNMAEYFRNVRKVYNEIRVEPRSTFEEQSHDTWLTSKVRTRLISRIGVVSHVKIVTSHSVVYLMGLVNGDEARIATDAARGLRDADGVIPLFERVDVAENSAQRFSPSPKNNADTESNDMRALSIEQQEKLEDKDTTVIPFELPPTPAEIPSEKPSSSDEK